MRRQARWAVAVPLAVIALAGCGTTGRADGTSAPTPVTRAAGGLMATAARSTASRMLARCGPAALTLAYGPGLSPMTGEHGVFYELVNHGRLPCALAGYPDIALYAGRTALPFRYAHGGGPYVTSAAPAAVTLQPGQAAWVLGAQYRCDLGIIRSATTIRLILPGAARAVLTGPVAQDGAGVPVLSYCRGGPGDPGQTVTVSPFESTKRATTRI